MRWIEALKIYNKDKMWCVPRKGTPEHAAVLTIMKGEQPKAPVRRKRIMVKEPATTEPAWKKEYPRGSKIPFEAIQQSDILYYSKDRPQLYLVYRTLPKSIWIYPTNEQGDYLGVEAHRVPADKIPRYVYRHSTEYRF